MNIQEENSARYFRVQSEREQTLVSILFLKTNYVHKTFSRTELARPVMGTIFLVLMSLVHIVQSHETRSQLSLRSIVAI